MSISPGFTDAEIRDFVFEYQRQPYGQKGVWLAEQSFSCSQFKRWQAAVLAGDLGRGLVPRDSRTMPSAGPLRRDHVERLEHEADRAELERLRARVDELEEVNDALGKAIGLLHQLNAQEPAVSPQRNDPGGCQMFCVRGAIKP